MVILPPTNAIGKEAMATGINIFRSKKPELMYLYETIVATQIFKTSEIGLMESGAKESHAIAAKYPEAPACPTDAYNVAITINKMIARIIIGSINYVISHLRHHQSNLLKMFKQNAIKKVKTLLLSPSQNYKI